MTKDKILIVDEEKWITEAVFDRIDSEFGMSFYDYAVDGNEALMLLKKNTYSVVILDLMLPLGDGLSLPKSEPELMYGIYILRKIREFNESIPVICYTVLSDTAIKKQIKKLNAIHIHKLDENSFDRLFDEIRLELGKKV